MQKVFKLESELEKGGGGSEIFIMKANFHYSCLFTIQGAKILTVLYARGIILICDSTYNNNAENWVNYINSFAFLIIFQ